MRPIALLVMSLLACVAASDTIKPLFETDSVTVYDRWLWQHRDEYPGFRPIRALVGEEYSGSGWTRLMSAFLTDSGTELVRYVYPDSWQGIRVEQVSNINVTEDGDHVAVYHRGASAAGTTAFDRLGRKLFDSKRDIVPRFNLWFRDTRTSDSTQVLNNNGKVIGVLPGLSIRAASGSGDTLIAAVSRRGTIVFDHSARIRWQDSMFGTAPRVAAISPDGRRVAVITRDSAGLHDLATGRNKTLGLLPETATRLRFDRVVWSDDSRRFAVYRADWDVVDTALLWTFTSAGQGSSRPRKLVTNCGERPFWTGDTILLIAAPYFSDLHWTANKEPTPGPCRVTAVAPRGGLQTWFVKGVFRWANVWCQHRRSFAYVDKSRSHAVVFEVPIK